jgi:methyl-accepting chemotaxis protein
MAAPGHQRFSGEVLSASSEVTSTAEILSSEVDKFFRHLRADPLERDGAPRMGTAALG